MAKNDFPVSLTIKAVDKATGPLSRITSKLANATAPLRRNMAGVGAAFGKVGTEALSLGAKLAGLGVAAGFGLFHVVKGAVDAGDKLNEMSKRVGLSADAYAQYSFAANQANVDQDAFNESMDAFVKGLGEAKAGTGRMLAFLKKTGPGFAQQVIGAKTTEEALGLMANAFERIKDPMRRAALANKVFGNKQMGQFLGQGSKAIKEQREEFLKIAGSQEEFAYRSNVLDDALKKLGAAFDGTSNRVMSKLFPAFNRLAIFLTKFIADHGDKLVAWAEEMNGRFQEWANNGGLEKLVDGIKNLGDKAGELLDKVGGLGGVLKIVGAYMAAPLVAAILSAGASLISLGSTALPLVVTGFKALYTAFNLIRLMSVGTMFAPLLAILGPLGVLIGIGAALYVAWKPFRVLVDDILDDLRGISKEKLALEGRVDEAVGPTQGVAITKTKFLDAAGARPQNTRHTNDAKVTIAVQGPQGTRATVDRNSTAPIDLSHGPSMVGAQ